MSIRKSETQTVVKQPEEHFLNFLIKVNAEFSGPELVLVLGFVENFKNNSNTEKLTKVIEDSQNGSYRNWFENIGVLLPKTNIHFFFFFIKSTTNAMSSRHLLHNPIINH